MQSSALQFIEQMQVSTNDFLGNNFFIICFGVKISLPFVGFTLNLRQAISRCFSLHSQHVRQFFFWYSVSSETFLSSFFSWLVFKKLEYIFCLKISFRGCWCFFVACWIEVILANGYCIKNFQTWTRKTHWTFSA